MTFDAIYYTADENDSFDGYRVIEAANLQDAKAVLKTQMAAEGVAYRLDSLIETTASYAARKAA